MERLVALMRGKLKGPDGALVAGQDAVQMRLAMNSLLNRAPGGELTFSVAVSDYAGNCDAWFNRVESSGGLCLWGSRLYLNHIIRDLMKKVQIWEIN